jgi:hypothetical protein
MDEYKFDRTAFKIMTFDESEAANKFPADISYSERLRQAYYLISRAYGFSIHNPPRLDKSIFSSRKLNS